MGKNLAVVILNYNGSVYLKKFLPLVIKYSDHYHVVVADNCSTDDSLKWLESAFPEVQIIRLPKNYGFARGYNEALKDIDAEYYILLNSDVEVTAGWAEPLIRLLEKNPNAAACQPKILDYNDKSRFEYAGAAGGFIDELAFTFCRGRIFDHVEQDHGQYNTLRKIFWASGACLMIRSKVFHEAGGFDDHFFAHMEEVDLCWRLQQKGWEIYCEPESKVYHVGGGTLHKSNPHKTYLNFRNSLALLYKNSQKRALIWKFPLRILFDWLAALKFIADGNRSDAIAVFKAQKNFLNNKEKWKKFKILNKPGKIKEKYNVILPGFVVIKYFLLFKREFSKLKF